MLGTRRRVAAPLREDRSALAGMFEIVEGALEVKVTLRKVLDIQLGVRLFVCILRSTNDV